MEEIDDMMPVLDEAMLVNDCILGEGSELWRAWLLADKMVDATTETRLVVDIELEGRGPLIDEVIFVEIIEVGYVLDAMLLDDVGLLVNDEDGLLNKEVLCSGVVCNDRLELI